MSSRQAACISCRRSKIRCKRGPGLTCEKCSNAGTECIVPGGFHVGRQRGVKNKRTGLEKAIHQVEEALKRSKGDAGLESSASEQLQQLLNEVRGQSSAKGDVSGSSDSTYAPLAQREEVAVIGNNEQLTLDDAENPLQLLARASDLRLASPQSSENPYSPSTLILSIQTNKMPLVCSAP